MLEFIFALLFAGLMGYFYLTEQRRLERLTFKPRASIVMVTCLISVGGYQTSSGPNGGP